MNSVGKQLLRQLICLV